MAQVKDGWSDWLKEHGNTLVLLARQYTGSLADAEDIVHEAFVSFWHSRDQARDATSYLYTCVRHGALNWQRSQARRQRREESSAKPDSQAWFEAGVEEDEERRALQDLIAGLPTEQREVLVMKIWGGLTFPQIALALEISANTAASRYRYALEKLRTHLLTEAST